MNILLVCAAGMSTSLLVNRMNEAAAAKGAPVQRGECDQLFPDCLHRRIGKRCERHAPELPAAAGLCL